MPYDEISYDSATNRYSLFKTSHSTDIAVVMPSYPDIARIYSLIAISNYAEPFIMIESPHCGGYVLVMPGDPFNRMWFENVHAVEEYIRGGDEFR